MTTPRAFDAWTPWLGARAGELSTGILFLTRLPLPRHAPMSGAAIADASWAFPLAGVVVGLIGAAIYALAHRVGLPPWPAAALTLTATLLVTGCLHEDGLADTADGFGGGDSREQKLAIMRDSRIGTYGVCALILSLVLRAGALASLAEPGLVAAALIASHAAARAIVPAVMFFLGPARTDGLSFSAGAPSIERPGAALAIAVVVLLLTLGFVMTVETLIVLAIVGVAMTRLSARQISGQTGDVLGAVEQIGEITVLLVAVR
jgi:adenosylcobinamide-GDP ribazoletransferase